MSGWIGAWGTGGTATVTNLTVTGSEIISVNTSTDALRITQTGTGNALVVEDSANPDSFPFVVDASGNVNIGVASSFTNAKLNVVSVGSEGPVMLTRASADVVGAELYLRKIRNSNPYVNTIVQSGDGLGYVVFLGNDGTNQVRAAQIDTYVDGTPGINDMPGRLVFSTTADGASTPTERMRIDSAGNVYGTSGTTGMTSGFFYIPAAGGAPSGVPTAVAGRVPMYYDTTNNNFYIYNGAWKKILLA